MIRIGRGNTDLFDTNIMTREISPEKEIVEEPEQIQKLTRRMSEINIQCNPALPFGKYFNRELKYMKKHLKVHNELLDEIYESILDTKSKVIYK